MLTISGNACEGCLELSYTDSTGPYNALSNPGGYGPENSIEGPEDFTTYRLDIWFPNEDTTGDPSFTYNLKTSIPLPDSNGFYTWNLTALQLGLPAITSGVWTFMATGVLNPNTYITDVRKIFVLDVKKEVVDPAMLKADPECECADCQSDPYELFSMFNSVACDGICSAATAQNLIDYLYTQKGCC